MSGRRIACKLCRDRKVRCDGGQPACNRCRRAGESCIYSQTPNPTKADLLQTIKTLNERVDSLLQQQTLNATTTTPNPNPNELAFDCSAFNLPTPSFVSDDPFLPSPGYPFDTTTTLDATSLDAKFLSYLPTPSPHSTETEHTPHSLIIDPHHIQRHTTPQTHTNTHLPTLREIRAQNQLPPCSPSSIPHDPADSTPVSDTISLPLSTLSRLALSTSTTHSQISGIASVVAEYLDWVRKRPTRGASNPAAEASWSVMLETLEMRVREVQDVAERGQSEVWVGMMAELREAHGGQLDSRLVGLDAEVNERLERVRGFFQDGYDVTIPLGEQMSPFGGVGGGAIDPLLSGS
ncbi:hypothetical protein BJX63DRAFT_436775 [Aspergillus granulosus]|uniref:Zn(2)-C6 fungal-type domain-containing protein n=1 Tax=Aspergillus granulosus TaxID=176169 RepID=A0ABR4GWY6_9EURO